MTVVRSSYHKLPTEPILTRDWCFVQPFGPAHVLKKPDRTTRE